MTGDELIEILRRGEGTRVEFKSDFPANAQAIGKEMAALANTKGGVLLLGVSDDGAPTGLSEPDKAVERLSGIARTCGLSVAPEIDKFQVSKNIFIVYAKVLPCAPCIYEGKVYHRVGSTSVECKSGEQLIAIIEGKFGLADDSRKVVAERTESQRKRGKTTEIEFFELLTKRPEEAVVARQILTWSRKNFTHINWEKSSFNPALEYGGDFSHNPITVLSNRAPRVVIKFGRMKRRNRFSEEELNELLRRLNTIEGVNLPRSSTDKFPHINLSELTNESKLKQFLRCIYWTINQVRTINEETQQQEVKSHEVLEAGKFATTGRQAFVLRIAPNGIDRVNEALVDEDAIIGWSKSSELLQPNLNRDQFREIIRHQYYSEDPDNRRAGLAAGQVWTFIREMKPGDILIIPHDSSFYLAQVIGDARHDAAKVPEASAFRRKVTWLNEKLPIPRKLASDAMQDRMNSRSTCTVATDLLTDVQDVLTSNAYWTVQNVGKLRSKCQENVDLTREIYQRVVREGEVKKSQLNKRERQIALRLALLGYLTCDNFRKDATERTYKLAENKPTQPEFGL